MANLQKQLEKVRKLDKTYVIFGRGTRQVFITCDAETYEDQVWIFSSEEKATDFAQRRQETNKDILLVVTLENKQLLQFYGNLYWLGVTELVFTDGNKNVKIPLDKLVKRSDFSQLPKERHPLMNSQMQLTGICFMQEIHRRLPNDEKPRLKELEEEMAANLVRTRFLMAAEGPKDGKKADGSSIRILCIRNREGKVFQPIFTDSREYSKFDREKKFRPVIVEFKNIEKVLGRDVEGIVVNPQSINIIILKNMIPILLKRFGK